MSGGIRLHILDLSIIQIQTLYSVIYVKINPLNFVETSRTLRYPKILISDIIVTIQ